MISQINTCSVHKSLTEYLQQHGATAHTARKACDYHREFFDGRIISGSTEIPYLSRSWDLNICDFFIWP